MNQSGADSNLKCITILHRPIFKSRITSLMAEQARLGMVLPKQWGKNRAGSYTNPLPRSNISAVSGTASQSGMM
jgi:hypothetical protein